MIDYAPQLAQVWTRYLRSLTGTHVTLSALNAETMMGLQERVAKAPGDYATGFVEPFPHGGAPEYPHYDARPCSEE